MATDNIITELQVQVNTWLDFMLSAHWTELDRNIYDEYYRLLMSIVDIEENCDEATVARWWVWAEDTECKED
jgi:hypothetical protein